MLCFVFPMIFGGDLISVKAQIFSGFVSMSFWLTMYTRNLLETIPNAHLRGLTSFCTSIGFEKSRSVASHGHFP